jgi:hypothetical protein
MELATMAKPHATAEIVFIIFIVIPSLSFLVFVGGDKQTVYFQQAMR